MADENAPEEGTPVEGAPVEGASAQEAAAEDTAAEDTAAEDEFVGGAPAEGATAEQAHVEDAAVEGGAADAAVGDAAAVTGSPDDSTTGASEPRRRTARVAGAALACAAAVAGAVWAITAIVDDDDHDDGACCNEDHATAIAPEQWRGAADDRGHRPHRHRDGWAERRGERFGGDRDGWAERGKRYSDKEREERSGRNRAYRSGPDHRQAAEGCMTVLSFGTGEDAVAVLVCNAPWAAGPGLDLGDDEWLFERRRPSNREGFGGFFRGGRLFGSPPIASGEFLGRLFEEFGEIFEDGLPFDFEDNSEGSFGGAPEGSFEDFFRDGDRGFRGGGAGGSERGLCFDDGDDELCLSDLGQLSDEDLEQFGRMMEMLEGFGPGGFLGGLLDSLDGLDLDLPESRTEPSGLTGA